MKSPSRPSHPVRALSRALSLVLLGMLATACQLSVASDILVRADGSGVLTVDLALDRELTEMLEDAGVDLTAGLTQPREDAFEVSTSRDDGALSVTAEAAFDDPTRLGDLVEGLHRGLDDDDPRILRDVRLDVADDGAAELTATAGLVLPEVLGAAGDQISFDADDLQRLLEERGDQLVRYDLRVTLPGSIVATDADDHDGGTATWRLPVGEERTVSARAEPSGARTPWLLAAAGLLVAGVTGVGVVALGRRRG